jgi:hypothetical protein
MGNREKFACSAQKLFADAQCDDTVGGHGKKARSKAKYITDEDILDVFWQAVSAGEASDSSTVRFETQVWDTVNGFSPFLRKLHLNVLNLPYWIMWLFWNAVVHKPFLRFEMRATAACRPQRMRRR